MGKLQTTRPETDSRRATYQDVLDAPPDKVAEVVDGTLYIFHRPAAPHALAGSVLGNAIGPPFHHGHGGPGGWWIIDEPELHLGEDIVVPDMAGWRRERMPVYPDTAYFTLAPDWVCEVLSPSTRKLDLGRQECGVRPGRCRIPMVRRPYCPLTGSECAARREVGGDCQAA